jgi:hypothetical protein
MFFLFFLWKRNGEIFSTDYNCVLLCCERSLVESACLKRSRLLCSLFLLYYNRASRSPMAIAAISDAQCCETFFGLSFWGHFEILNLLTNETDINILCLNFSSSAYSQNNWENAKDTSWNFEKCKSYTNVKRALKKVFRNKSLQLGKF